MKSKRPTRCGLAIAVFVGVLAVFSASPETAHPVERITAVTVAGKTTPAETVEIVLLRWSTDAERSQFLPILSGKPTKEGDALDKVLLGYVWGSGGIGYVVRYAERQDDRITLVVNRNLGWCNKPNWTPAPSLTYGQLLMRIGNEAYEGIKWEYERGVSPEIQRRPTALRRSKSSKSSGRRPPSPTRSRSISRASVLLNSGWPARRHRARSCRRRRLPRM